MPIKLHAIDNPVLNSRCSSTLAMNFVASVSAADALSRGHGMMISDSVENATVEMAFGRLVGIE